MPISYPGSLDNLVNPAASDTLAAVPHDAQHDQVNDAIEALEAKVGIGASTAAARQALVSTGAGASAWQNFGVITKLFDVKDYGGVLNGVADDTTAFQNTVNAARSAAYLGGGGKVVFTGIMKLTSEVTLQPASGSAFQLDIEGYGSAVILWRGASNTSVIHSYGWKYSTVKNIDIIIGGAAAVTNVTAWDFDHDSTRNSTGLVTFEDCSVVFTSTATSCFGWILGKTTFASPVRDESHTSFISCSAIASSRDNLNVGWVVQHLNALNNKWFACITGGMGISWQLGAEGAFGSGSQYFYGCGGTNNAVEFQARTGSGGIVISGGRWEVGRRFLDHEGAFPGTGPSGKLITLTSVDIHAFAPTDGVLFETNKPDQLILDNVGIVTFDTAGPYSASMIQLGGATTGKGSLIVRGGVIMAADPFWTVSQGGWSVRIEDVQKATEQNAQATAKFTPRNPDRATGTASITNGSTISHGLGRVPGAATITPTVAKRLASVTAKSSTTLTVSLHDDTGAAIVVAENVDWWTT